MKKFILALDQGTTGSTALLISHDLKIKARANIEFKQHYPKPGWVEHDPEEIWAVTCKAMKQALQQAKVKASQIAGIGITNQRETVVMWDKKNQKSLAKAIVWQDRRTADFCEALKKKGALKTVRSKTGLVLDPYFSGTKIRWLLQNNKDVKKAKTANRLACGTIDSFLVNRLTNGKVHVTDVTNASRTLLMNIKTMRWDKELLKMFSVPADILPEIRSCSEIYGHTKSVPGLPDGIPIAGMAGDQQAALFGQACFSPGEAKCTYGTGSFLLMNIGSKATLSKSGLLTTVAWQVGAEINYALEGSAFIAGAAVQWLRDEMGFIKKSSEVEALARSAADNGGVQFVPALAGLGAPYWDANARGVLCGLTRGSNRAHVARAVLEGIALSQYDILSAMQKDAAQKLKRLKVDGGASANDLLMQIQADCLETKIVRPKALETTAMGAAFLAGLAVGFWKSKKEISRVFQADKEFKPKMAKGVRDDLIKNWKKAIERARVH
ncbi:MAG: glycerol kinase GlpK [Deltaproteobacteria bacterium]|nr:glycerol kinase GlpK [Deltaproteobacteria bacterium]